MTKHITLLCTCPDEESAELISRSLLEKRFCACINQIKNCHSVYRWQGTITHDEEILLIIKTTQARYDDIEAAIIKQHPYDIPEIIALPVIAGSKDYLSWLENAVEDK